MNQTPEALGTSPSLTPESPSFTPGWQNCLDCTDLGTACNGPSLRTLGNIASARAFHKALVKCRNIPLKRVAEVVKDSFITKLPRISALSTTREFISQRSHNPITLS